MLLKKIGLIAGILLLVLLVASSETPNSSERSERSPNSTELEAKIEQLIKDLGAEDWQTREAATKALEEIGEPAEPFLKEALPNPDPEVSMRAEKLLRRIELSRFGSPPTGGSPLLYGRHPLSLWTLSAILMDGLHYPYGRSPLSLWTASAIFTDGLRYPYGRPPLSLWTASSILTDGIQYPYGRHPLSLRTVSTILTDGLRYPYGRPPLSLRTASAILMDGIPYPYGRRPVSIWTASPPPEQTDLSGYFSNSMLNKGL